MDAAVAEVRRAQQRRLRRLSAQKLTAQRAGEHIACAMHGHIDGFLLHKHHAPVKPSQIADTAAGADAGDDCVLDLLRV